MCQKRTIIIHHKNRLWLLTNASDQIILVDKSSEACMMEQYHSVKLSQTPTQRGMRKAMPFPKGKMWELQSIKIKQLRFTHLYIDTHSPQILLITYNLFQHLPFCLRTLISILCCQSIWSMGSVACNKLIRIHLCLKNKVLK